jgi:hypothetical protein
MSALSLVDAKAYLNITVATHDTELQTVINSAEAAIEALVGPLSPRTVTARVPGNSAVLLLPTIPAASLTSVTPFGGSAMDLASFDLDATAGIVNYPGGSGTYPSTYYTIVYEAGRDPVPADLMMAVKELVRHLWGPQRGGSVRPGSSPAEGLSNTLPGAAYSLPIRVTQLLTPHMQPGFA